MHCQCKKFLCGLHSNEIWLHVTSNNGHVNKLGLPLASLGWMRIVKILLGNPNSQSPVLSAACASSDEALHHVLPWFFPSFLWVDSCDRPPDISLLRVRCRPQLQSNLSPATTMFLQIPKPAWTLPKFLASTLQTLACQPNNCHRQCDRKQLASSVQYACMNASPMQGRTRSC